MILHLGDSTYIDISFHRDIYDKWAYPRIQFWNNRVSIDLTSMQYEELSRLGPSIEYSFDTEIEFEKDIRSMVTVQMRLVESGRMQLIIHDKNKDAKLTLTRQQFTKWEKAIYNIDQLLKNMFQELEIKTQRTELLKLFSTD